MGFEVSGFGTSNSQTAYSNPPPCSTSAIVLDYADAARQRQMGFHGCQRRQDETPHLSMLILEFFITEHVCMCVRVYRWIIYVNALKGVRFGTQSVALALLQPPMFHLYFKAALGSQKCQKPPKRQHQPLERQAGLRDATGNSGLLPFPTSQLPISWVPVLGSLYKLILSITQDPTIWVPGLLGIVNNVISTVILNYY